MGRWPGSSEESGRDEPIQIIHTCMEAMLGISLYSYHYLKLQMRHVFLITAYVFSSIKLEKRVEQVLPGSKVFGGEREGEGGEVVGGEREGEGGEVVQTIYEHMNK
jgi:hypothetical protein